jgi:hypothetical protein
MSEPYRRFRSFYQDISNNRHVASSDTGLITLVTVKNANYTLFIQKIHIEITTGAAQTWTFQDSAGTPVPIVPSVSVAAVAHFDFDFGPNGVPCTVGTNFVLNISGAGAVGWATWEGYQQLTVVTDAKST